jgi:hypothetical protein
VSEQDLHIGGSCDDTEASLAELALGILSGEERARVLAHLEDCERCRVEAERLTATADSLLYLAPAVEPPLGLEVKLFEQLGVTVPTSDRKVASRSISASLARVSHRGRVIAAAAAVTIGVAIGFGGGWLANSGPSVATSPYPPHVASATATLVSDSQSIGSVSTIGTSPQWLMMTVANGPVSGPVTCEIIETNGTHLTIGRFRLDDGYGAWASKLPRSVSGVRVARIVTPDGAVVGRATFAKQRN